MGVAARQGTSSTASAAEQPFLKLAQLGHRDGAELVAQSPSQALVDAERFSAGAAGGEKLHQQSVTALSIRGDFDQFTRRAFAGPVP